MKIVTTKPVGNTATPSFTVESETDCDIAVLSAFLAVIDLPDLFGESHELVLHGKHKKANGHISFSFGWIHTKTESK